MKALLENIELKRAQAAVLAGFWNGKDPKKPLERQQGAAMMLEALSKPDPKLAIENAWIELDKLMGK